MIRLPGGAGLALVALVACGELPLENEVENGPGEPTAQAALTPSLPGCSRNWTASGDGNWSDPTRWFPVGVPTFGDVVCILAPGTYTVTAASRLFRFAA